MLDCRMRKERRGCGWRFGGGFWLSVWPWSMSGIVLSVDRRREDIVRVCEGVGGE